MKKRLLSILLALCMVICLVPMSAFAEGETTKKVETEQELVDALADSAVDIVTLKSDIAIGSTLTVNRTVTLDIYGYMLEISGSGSVIKIADGGHLTLKDSDPTSTYKFTPDADGLWKWGTGGTKTVNGGVIYGGKSEKGGGVYIDGGTFEMFGGNIVGCTATNTSNSAWGGGVFVLSGQFNMTGGSITGCTAVTQNEAAYGGGVCISGGIFTMTGGSITNCTVAAQNEGWAAWGGGICNYRNGSTTLSGTAKIQDCRATATGTNNRHGGGLLNNGTLNISGDVMISGCTADGNSDAVFTYSGTISGGTFNGTVVNNLGTISGGMFYGGISGSGSITGLTVTYRVDDKDYAMQVLQSGMTAQKPEEFTKDGCVFIGWYNGDTAYDFTNPVTSDITLTAKWAKLCDKTADFTATDGGAEAIALLNSAKTGSENSAWNNGTKTLTLKGVSFATTATTAVKLPDGATVILADGTENRIIGGGATAAQDGKYQKQIYIYGIYAAGALTVQGETNGTGKLYVNSGEHINSGNAWTYSVALYAEGNLTLKGGAVTAQGGKTSSGDCAFSFGVDISEGHGLSVFGGTLTGIGGESFDTEEPSNARESFSEGIDIYKSNVTVSGNGKIVTETVADMADKGLSYGLRINIGNLYVSDSASFTAAASHAINISNGDLKLSGGKISALGTNDGVSAVTVGRDWFSTANGNIEVSGGEFECSGGIYMDGYNAGEGQAMFSVTGGKVTANHIYGPNKLTVSIGTVISGHINADTVQLQSGSLTVREAVRKYPNRNDLMYASHAIYCKNLLVSGGTLDAAWDWGEYTPIAFPASWYSDDYVQPLIKIPDGTASFSGGTVIFNTGCAGNTALKVGTLNLSGGIRGSGYTNEDGGDTYIQKDGSTPVKFTVYPADYTNVDAALDKVKTLDKNLYKDFSTVDAAVNEVVRGKNIDEQAAVDAMAKTIEAAINTLEYKDADYSKVDEAIARSNALNKDEYKDFSAVQSAINAVVRGKNITEQSEVDSMAKAIENAISALEYKDADYSKVDTAIAKANALNKDEYKDFSAVQSAINAVVRGKNITEQTAVDAMAEAIEDAINALEYKDADYSKVDEAVAKANALSKDEYKDFSAVQSVINAVVRGKNITEQSEVDAMAKAIENAINALEYKDADYSKVDEAIAKANALNKDEYKDFSAVQSAINAVVRGKNITEQSEVDAMAKAIESVINALEKKPAEIKENSEKDTVTGKLPSDKKSPQTGASGMLALCAALLLASGGTAAVISTRKKKKFGKAE